MEAASVVSVSHVSLTIFWRTEREEVDTHIRASLTYDMTIREVSGVAMSLGSIKYLI